MKKKETKPSYIVDMDDIEHLDEVAVVFALAKHNAGIALTDSDLLAIITHVAEHTAPKFYICDMVCECKPKRKPWYKRFWNWLLRK